MNSQDEIGSGQPVQELQQHLDQAQPPNHNDRAASPQVSMSNASAANINDNDDNLASGIILDSHSGPRHGSGASGAEGPEGRQTHSSLQLTKITSKQKKQASGTGEKGAEANQIYQQNDENAASNREYAIRASHDEKAFQMMSQEKGDAGDNPVFIEVQPRQRGDTVLSSFNVGAPSPYNYNNSKLKTMSNGFASSFNPNSNPFGAYRNMNAVVPSSSFTSKFGKGYNAQEQFSLKRNAAKSLRSKIRKAEAVVLDHKKDMLELRNVLSERVEKTRKLGQHIQSSNDGDKNCQQCIFKTFPCFSKCFSSLKYEEHMTVNLRVETITCNKLSHCLFDFDCPDFNAQYENEKYEHHVFKQKNLVANPRDPKMMSLIDQQFERDDMLVSVRDVHFNKTNFLQLQRSNENDRLIVDLPFPKARDNNKNNFIFRIVLKSDTGDLWGFNKFDCEKDMFQETDYLQLLSYSHPALKSSDFHEENNTKGQVSATLDDIGLNDMSHHDIATHRQGERKDTNYLNESAFDNIHSRLNILDDQITVNYDLSQPTLGKTDEDNNNNGKSDEQGAGKGKKKRLSKRQKIAKQNNFKELTQEQIDQEIEFENNVDLDKTMWLVMRDKRSVNNILKRFETKNQLHYLKVNDIVKFGRVNFKISIIKSEMLIDNIQGGYHLLEKKNQEIQEQLEKLQNQQTQQQTMAEGDGNSKIPLHLSKGHLDNDLVPRNGKGLVKNYSQSKLPFNNLSPGEHQQDDFNDDERLPTQENVVNEADFALGRPENMTHLERGFTRPNTQINQDFDDSRGNLQTLHSNIHINENNEPILFMNNYGQNQQNRFKVNINRGLGANPKWLLDDESLRSSVSKMSSAMVSSAKPKSESGELVCRICLGTEEEGTPDENGQPDKLICPCKCAGSMGMIHISCLKEWVNGKRLVYKGKKVQSFFWKALECELCNEAFENRMKYRMFSIMKIDLPNDGSEYMIFESIKSAPAKVIHVFDLSKCNNKHKNLEDLPKENEFRVGRSVETDMRIADISVSRVHSFIRILGNRLILQDNGSKFGTLVKVLKPKKLLQLKDENGNEFPQNYKYNSTIYQVGKTMFYFKFYDQKKKLAQQQLAPLTLRKDMKFDPNDDRLAFVAWKGTTIHRKTMNESEIEMIPREFVNSTFTFGKGTINKLSKLRKVAEDFDEESDNLEDDQRLEESPSITLKNSIEGDQSMVAIREKNARSTLENTAQETLMEKQIAQKIDSKYMAQSNNKNYYYDNEDDEIKDLYKGDKYHFNKGSPFKNTTQLGQNRQHQTPDTNMVFADGSNYPHNNNEQDEPPVNILRAVNRNQHQAMGGGILSNIKKHPTAARLEGADGNTATNVKRSGGPSELENVLSSQQDFQSSQSINNARNSPMMSLGQSPQDFKKLPNFKNVRNLEVKERIAKNNEEGNRAVILDGGRNDAQEKIDRNANNASNLSFINKVIQEEYSLQFEQNKNQDSQQDGKNQQAAPDAEAQQKVVVINEHVAEELIDGVSKQQFLSIRDIEETNQQQQQNRIDQIDSQHQNYNSQLVAQKTTSLLVQKEYRSGAVENSLAAGKKATSNQSGNVNAMKNSSIMKQQYPGAGSESASFGTPSLRQGVTNEKFEGRVNLTKTPISRVGLSDYGSLNQSKGQTPHRVAQDQSLEKNASFEQDQAQMRQPPAATSSLHEERLIGSQMLQRAGEAIMNAPEDSSDNQIKS